MVFSIRILAVNPDVFPGLYSTGVDSQNHPLPQGVTDPHYQVLVPGRHFLQRSHRLLFLASLHDFLGVRLRDESSGLMGDAGYLSFGYSKEKGDQVGFGFKQKDLKLSAEFGKESIVFNASYSFAGDGRFIPKAIEGAVGLKVTVDNKEKDARVYFILRR